MKCAVPPRGWECSRERGHGGPCAASPSALTRTWIAFPPGKGNVWGEVMNDEDGAARYREQGWAVEGPYVRVDGTFDV